MRNFVALLVGMLCLFSVSIYAGDREKLQKEIADLLKTTILSEIRESHEKCKPIWQTIRTELVSISEAPVETLEQIQTAQKRLLLVQTWIMRLEVRREIAVVANGYTENEYQIPPDEFSDARTKIDALKLALENAKDAFSSIKVRLQLFGIIAKGHISVAQHVVKFHLAAMRQGNAQLIVWWEKNKKSQAGLEKLKVIQQTLSALEPQTDSTDRRVVAGRFGGGTLRLRLVCLDLEVIGIFRQEP